MAKQPQRPPQVREQQADSPTPGDRVRVAHEARRRHQIAQEERELPPQAGGRGEAGVTEGRWAGGSREQCRLGVDRVRDAQSLRDSRSVGDQQEPRREGRGRFQPLCEARGFLPERGIGPIE